MQVFKKIWFFIILIVLITAVSGTIYEIALGNHHLVQDRSKSFYQILREPENSVDAVVVGDSLSYTSISPMELWKEYGMTFFVCGQSGQTTQETYYMLKNVFKRQSPGLIIMETHSFFKEHSKQGDSLGMTNSCKTPLIIIPLFTSIIISFFYVFSYFCFSFYV